MFDDIQNNFNISVRKMAENKLIKKLNKQGLSRSYIGEVKFKELLEMEIDIIKNDGKKVASGIGVGVALSILTGGIF